VADVQTALVSLAAVAAFFVFVHLAISGTRIRDGLVRVQGEDP
jgi:hypothetical protein